MKKSLPTIYSAGLFDSQKKFPDMTVTSPRKTAVFELEYFFEDGGTSVINDKAYPIKSGSLLFARPGDVRYSHLPFRCKFLHFSVSDPELAEALSGIDSFYETFHAPRIDAAFSDIIAHFYSADPFDNILASAELISLLHFISTQSHTRLSAVSRAREYVEHNYMRDLSTADIAAACSVSVSYLHRLFRTELNTTPADLLLSCRIAAARDLLINTGLPLSEIAERCGFHSQSYFSDCFRRQVGMTPGQFRRGASYTL